MTAGQPDWQKLHAMGKLPKDQQDQVPYLAELEKIKARVTELEDGLCEKCRVLLMPIEGEKGEEGKPSVDKSKEVPGDRPEPKEEKDKKEDEKEKDKKEDDKK